MGPDRPYPARTEPLPRRLEDVTPEWLSGVLAARYPGVEVHGFDQVECKNSHTTPLAPAHRDEMARRSGR